MAALASLAAGEDNGRRSRWGILALEQEADNSAWDLGLSSPWHPVRDWADADYVCTSRLVRGLGLAWETGQERDSVSWVVGR